MARVNLRAHPKFKRLVARLKLPAPYVRGLLDTMWDVGYQTGSPLLGSPEDVELAAEWPRKPGEFFAAIKDDWLDLVDGQWHIHDLLENAPEYAKKKIMRRLNNKELSQKTADIEGQTADKSRQMADNVPPLQATARQVTTTNLPTGDPPAPSRDAADAGAANELVTGLPLRQPAEPSPVAMVFPVKGNGPGEWALRDAKVAEYREVFPGVDILAECRRARQWCIDHPNKQKTHKGIQGFLTRWLGRAQDQCGGGLANRGTPGADVTEARAREIAFSVANRSSGNGRG